METREYEIIEELSGTTSTDISTLHAKWELTGYEDLEKVNDNENWLSGGSDFYDVWADGHYPKFKLNVEMTKVVVAALVLKQQGCSDLEEFDLCWGDEQYCADFEHHTNFYGERWNVRDFAKLENIIEHLEKAVKTAY